MYTHNLTVLDYYLFIYLLYYLTIFSVFGSKVVHDSLRSIQTFITKVKCDELLKVMEEKLIMLIM